MSNEKVHTALDFFNKYGLLRQDDRLDTDVNTPGVQTEFDIDELVSDYNGLEAEELYVVFLRLASGKENEFLIRHILADRFFEPPIEVLKDLKSEFERGWYQQPEDLWLGRLAILEGLFIAQN